MTQLTRYQGRDLPRPDDDLADQGLGFDVTTLLRRRRMLALLGLGSATVGLAACGVTSSADPVTPTASGASGSTTPSASGGDGTGGASVGEIPEETAGPYPGDGSNGADVLEQSGIVRRDLRSSFGTGTATAVGVPMELTLRILDLAGGGGGFAGVAVYVWACDAEGRYSMYSSGVENENYLRGVQVAGADGRVTFTSIVPGCYSGRWPHIHFEVYPDQAAITDHTTAIATSQVALPDDLCRLVYARSEYPDSMTNLDRVSLAGDNVFGDDGGAAQLATVTGDVTSGYRVSLDAGVDTRTTPGSGGGPGGPDSGPGQPGPRR